MFVFFYIKWFFYFKKAELFEATLVFWFSWGLRSGCVMGGVCVRGGFFLGGGVGGEVGRAVGR